MNEKNPDKSCVRTAGAAQLSAREERLAAALRANLARRKAQARQRDAVTGDDTDEAETGPEGNL
ncbi:hypothetical protein [Rhodobacter maris]|uniref:Uncharacterized protein n=1 Tax=Rhodobacter maris TaxID=446682 RepID=A0A285S9H6_9RHOB|nr:hypothetical protein [Rhodobacter maris]SOC01988.1 hypothetical protein SAMN05877831_10353 [Rhodobacter maris]